MINQTTRRSLPIVCAAMMLLTMFGGSASAQSRRYGSTITVYTNPNFGGQSTSFRDDTPDLRSYNLSDKISSLEISGGDSWEVCQDINFGNRCQVFTGSVSDLRSIGWNDRISSLRRVNAGYRGTSGSIWPSNGSQGLVLYDRTNFRGNTTMVTSDSSAGLGSRLGSAEVRGGAWELCDRTGRCATISRDVSDLSQLGLTGRITSAYRVNSGQNNGTRSNQGNHYGWRNNKNDDR